MQIGPSNLMTKESFMSRDSDTSNLSRRHFLAVAGGVAVASSVAAAKDLELAEAAAVSINYPVTIDARTTPFKYTTNVPVAGTDAYHLHVAAATSTVTFTVVTSGANQHSAAIFFPNDTPFVDLNARPMNAFAWSESEEGAKLALLPMDQDASGRFEYRVVVFDKLTGTTVSEDPKIIVGTGGFELETQVFKELNELSISCPKESEKIKSVEGKLKQLFNY
jgi:hypothetical protein